MKRVLVLFGIAAYLWACGDNNVGNRVYQQNTSVDSASQPAASNTHDDTTATTNNNIYNPDSMPPNTTRHEIGSATGQTTPNQEEQARISAGASLPENNKLQDSANKRRQ